MTDRDKLLAEQNELLDKKDSIEHQLEMAEALLQKKKKPIDPEWRASATYALKCTRRRINRIQQEIAEIKRDVSEQYTIRFERKFVDTAEQELDYPTFDAILRKTSAALEHDSGTQTINQ